MERRLAMERQEFADYLSMLLGRRISLEDWVRLTSGQQARAGGWLVEHGSTIADLRARLSASFQTTSLLDGAGPTLQSFPPSPSRRPKIDGAPVNLRIGIDIQRIDELL